MTDIHARGYAHPDVLVSTDWVQDHLDNPTVRLVESNEDTLLYAAGHVPGAVHVDWTADLNDQLRRDYISRDGFEALMSRIGVTPETLVVFYGDKSNWWACYALWVFQLFGHERARIMDGGRLKWEKEGRPMTRDVPRYTPTAYKAPERNDALHRVFREDVLAAVKAGGQLVDVRSPEEYSGTRLHMPDYPNEGALRGGHIPGAKNIPWARAINPDDGTFKDADALRTLYVDGAGFDPSREVIAYCRIGERSSHTWFALKYLLGFSVVRNYDGSWTEWGNLVNVPIEK
ncbi:MAG: sulfurtransferase [Acidobacteria bacterium]|jgi:thiosulfate/3-mercaptopyruvate sulfurtransferase|nr:sulfurtransferase [Acidobacteriota bacterium]